MGRRRTPADGQGLPKPIADIVAVEPAKRTTQQKKLWPTTTARSPRAGADPQAARRAAEAEGRARSTVPTTLVSTAVPPRVMRVLPRGNWLDESGEVVTPGVPASLPPLGVKDRRATRLDLARWLVVAATIR